MSKSVSPYWDFVRKNGGHEPEGNNADTLLDPASVPAPEQTHKGSAFAAWMAYGFDKLTDRQKEVFGLSFKQGLTDVQVAVRLGIIPRRVKQIKARLRAIIAASAPGVI